MPTLTELLEAPEAFVLDTVMTQNPEYLQKCVDYMSIPQNVLLCNERECYLYPARVAEMLAQGTAYRLLVQKRQEGESSCYPYLQRLFTNISKEEADATLLGYCSRVLTSLVKKTPEVYQFAKDNQSLVLQLLQDDDKVWGLRDFLAFFLSESTMELYVFLKSMLIRNLVFRIVEDENVGAAVYACLHYLYDHSVSALAEAPQDEKAELQEVCKNFEDEHFLTLLVLKLEPNAHLRNKHIAQFLLRAATRNEQACALVAIHVDSILDFLEQYEESSGFMQSIGCEQLAVLKLLVQLVRLQKLKEELVGQLIKRLLVYSNVHASNSLIHNLLMRTIAICREQGKLQLLQQLNILEFFLKSQAPQRFGFMSLRRRVFAYWFDHHLETGLPQQDLQGIREEYNQRKKLVDESNYYKDAKIDIPGTDFAATKLPSDLAAMSIN